MSTIAEADDYDYLKPKTDMHGTYTALNGHIKPAKQVKTCL